MKTKLYHHYRGDQPPVVTDKSGRFESWLFFTPYAQADDKVITVSVDKDDILDIKTVFYREDYEKLSAIVASIMQDYACDEETAQSLLDQTKTLSELGIDDQEGELGWDLQLLAAKAGQLLGYNIVAVPDEYGTSYMIDMLSHR